MKYRPEIDGLRAIAVLLVILFHIGLDHFKGGFVGVDVFFVISGYLITTIILSEKEQGTFSLVKFYERRARRILPPLFLIMLVSTPFAWLWLRPTDLKDFAESLVAVATVSSNILFWQDTGYWGTVNELKPLLHTWSLAVEEQYYILFPLFVMLIWRFRPRWRFGALIVIALLSLILAQWGAYHEPVATFFLLPMRGWEIMIGASLAFYSRYRQSTMRVLLSNQAANEALGLVGLLMIGYAVYAFDENVPFPSFYALIPTVGTALILIFSSAQTVVQRLLSTKLLVGIGLISYSAYLWHQPILAFARQRSLTEPSQTLLFALAMLSFPLAYLSWRYVERPFRNRNLIGRKAIFTYAIAGSIVFIVLGLVGQVGDGFSQRTNKNDLTLEVLEDKLQINHGLDVICDTRFTLSPNCRTSDVPEILVWGDSFAMHLVQGILASNPDAKLIQMTKSECGPFFDLAPISRQYPASWPKGCLDFTAQVREWLKANPTVKYVVVSSSFDQYFLNDTTLLRRDNTVIAPDMDIVLQEFQKTLDELKALGATPVVFSPTPRHKDNIGQCLFNAAWHGVDLDACNFPIANVSPARAISYQFLEKINRDYRVINLEHFICQESVCVTHLGSTLMFRDYNHLTHEGSAALGTIYDFYRLIVADSSTSP